MESSHLASGRQFTQLILTQVAIYSEPERPCASWFCPTPYPARVRSWAQPTITRAIANLVTTARKALKRLLQTGKALKRLLQTGKALKRLLQTGKALTTNMESAYYKHGKRFSAYYEHDTNITDYEW
ncbi:MAG: hypothetical protein GDA56_20575 [Hormoscilla sp. GM7CHS1pb]|nr:hypothetical protein [Hormoscilla sp. GM7CHS1pb]